MFLYDSSDLLAGTSPTPTLENVGGPLRNELHRYYQKPFSPGGFGNKPILIIAHSMGGLVARSFMQQHWFPDGPQSGERVLRLITLATMHHGERTRKEDLARQLAERDGIQEGLVCVFAVVEPCRTFSLRWREGSAFIQSARRKCLSLYYYFMDRELGLIHVRLQTWFPMQLQVFLEGS